MSEREQERAMILAQVERGALTRAEAADLLELSPRHLRRVYAAWRKAGLAGLVHRGRGRTSNRAYPPQVRERALALIREHYPDFGPTRACEALAERHKLGVGLETLRCWMRAAGLHAGSRRAPRKRRLRPRRERRGELVQMDTSIHPWLEGRCGAAGEPVLIAMIDDATSRLWARFYPADTTEANMDLLADYMAHQGRPQALYTDRASHFVVNLPAGGERVVNPASGQAERPLTQIGRALGQLRIRHIAAGSPQAKGRIERAFRTLQERLVGQLRLDGARTLEEANQCLRERFVPWWNRTLTIAPLRGSDGHRPLTSAQRLEVILCPQEERTVANDLTIQVGGARWQLRGRARGLRPGAKVCVEFRRDGTRYVRCGREYVPFTNLTGAASWRGSGRATPSLRPAKTTPPHAQR